MPPLATNASDTRRKLLDAAARVFARNGREGATTREIAREAGVNEVTLFRHFHSKDKLLAEVVQRTFDRQEESLAGAPGSPIDGPSAAVPDLRAELRPNAERYHDLLAANLPLIRTLIGEIHRHQEQEMRVFKGMFHPVKAEVVAILERAQQRGEIRPGIEPVVAGDIFGSMIFIEVLRRDSPNCPDYSTANYLENCVDIFARGIEL